MDYFLTIQGMNGGSKSAVHKNTFEVKTFNFDLANIVAAAGGGAGGGKPVFQPLVVDIDAGASLTGLLKATATGQLVPLLRLQGANANGQTLYDLRLGEVKVTRMSDGNGTDRLAFSFAKVSLTTRELNPDGSLGAADTFAFNLKTLTSGATALAAAATGAAGGSAPATDYFLTVQGMDGGVDAKNHVGAFDVRTFNFDVSNLAAVSAGGGSGLGKASFAPLTIEIEPGAQLNGLMKAAALGTHIPLLRLQGVSPTDKTVYDLRLADVIVSKVTDTSGIDKLSFSYAKVTLTTTDMKADGSLATPQTYTYDLKVSAASNSKVAAAAAGATGGHAATSDFYLTVPGLNGGSDAARHAGDFDVKSFKLDISNTFSFAAGAGGGIGKSTFSPLTVNLEDDSPLVGLLKLAAKGQHLPTLRLQGVNNDDRTVYDLKLSDVTVNRVIDGIASDRVDFNFTKFSLTTRDINSNGSLDAAQTFVFDLKTLSLARTAPANAAMADEPTHFAGSWSPDIDFLA